MFDFDESIEIKCSPMQEFMHRLKDMLAYIDSAKGCYSGAFLNGLVESRNKAEEAYLKLSPTEQSKPGVYWQGVTGMVTQLQSLGAIAAMMAGSLVPMIRQHIVNTIGQIS